MDHYWLVAGILFYILVLVVWPNFRRAWLIFGGTLGGAMFVFAAGFTAIQFFFPGWAGFGLIFWFWPVLLCIGGLAGFLLVLWWTRPPESPASQPSEER